MSTKRDAERIPIDLWRWVRGDLADDLFAEWLRSQALESWSLDLNATSQLRLLDSSDGTVTKAVRKSLAASLPRECLCPLFTDRQWLGIWEGTLPNVFLPRFHRVQQRTAWLQLLRCKQCEHHWYAAYDTVGDAWYLERLTAEAAKDIVEYDRWPSTFDDFDSVWPPESGSTRSKRAPSGFTAGVVMPFY